MIKQRECRRLNFIIKTSEIQLKHLITEIQQQIFFSETNLHYWERLYLFNIFKADDSYNYVHFKAPSYPATRNTSGFLGETVRLTSSTGMNETGSVTTQQCVWTSKLSLGPDLLPRFSCPGPQPSMPAVYPLARPQSLINVVWAGAVRNGRENHGISPSESQWHPAAAGVNRWLTTGLLAACGDSHGGRAANVALTFRWIRKFLGSALVVSEVVGIVIICVLLFFCLTPQLQRKSRVSFFSPFFLQTFVQMKCFKVWIILSDLIWKQITLCSRCYRRHKRSYFKETTTSCHFRPCPAAEFISNLGLKLSWGTVLCEVLTY